MLLIWSNPRRLVSHFVSNFILWFYWLRFVFMSSFFLHFLYFLFFPLFPFKLFTIFTIFTVFTIFTIFTISSISNISAALTILFLYQRNRTSYKKIPFRIFYSLKLILDLLPFSSENLSLSLKTKIDSPFLFFFFSYYL